MRTSSLITVSNPELKCCAMAAFNANGNCHVYVTTRGITKDTLIACNVRGGRRSNDERTRFARLRRRNTTKRHHRIALPRQRIETRRESG